MHALDRVRNLIVGQPVDHLAAQPMTMLFAAKHAGWPYIGSTRDGRKLAESQLLREPSRLCKFMISDPLDGSRMHDRIKAIEIMCERSKIGIHRC